MFLEGEKPTFGHLIGYETATYVVCSRPYELWDGLFEKIKTFDILNQNLVYSIQWKQTEKRNYVRL